MNVDSNYDPERHRMVAEQIAARGLNDPRLLEAFERVPRHRFIPGLSAPHWAYADSPYPIGFGQSISQPYIVALMIDCLHLTGREHILEVGTGSGYQAAILSLLAAEVHTVEVIPELARHAAIMLTELGYHNVLVHAGDGSRGWPDAAPYDGILVAAVAPQVPTPLLDQLAEGGSLVIPVGEPKGMQYLEEWMRVSGELTSRRITSVAFVPLRGEHGWKGKA
jgi:protein-L-isoaspartate(D-aspartate) O-methyltransferase